MLDLAQAIRTLFDPSIDRMERENLVQRVRSTEDRRVVHIRLTDKGEKGDANEAVIKALAGACPERAMAGWSRRFRIAIQGEDPRTGRNFIWHMFQARPGGGASSANCPSGLEALKSALK